MVCYRYTNTTPLWKKCKDLVKAGEVIAKAGDTGELSTGWHLHFELWINGYSVTQPILLTFQKPYDKKAEQKFR